MKDMNESKMSQEVSVVSILATYIMKTQYVGLSVIYSYCFIHLKIHYGHGRSSLNFKSSYYFSLNLCGSLMISKRLSYRNKLHHRINKGTKRKLSAIISREPIQIIYDQKRAFRNLLLNFIRK